jgi:hypothetical protein
MQNAMHMPVFVLVFGKPDYSQNKKAIKTGRIRIVGGKNGGGGETLGR